MTWRLILVLLRGYLNDVAFLQKNTKDSCLAFGKNEIWYFSEKSVDSRIFHEKHVRNGIKYCSAQNLSIDFHHNFCSKLKCCF